MGLSASQARLLSITARLSDNELHSQQIANSKVRLADKTQEASQEYLDSLNATKLVFTTYNSDGGTIQNPLTAGLMYQYADMKNQYGISNTSGQLLVSATDAMNFENSANVSEFVSKYGVELVDNPKYIAALEAIYGENYGQYFDANDKYGWNTTIDGFTSGDLSTIKQLVTKDPKDLTEADGQTVLNAIQKWTNSFKTNGVEDPNALSGSFGAYVDELLNFTPSFPKEEDYTEEIQTGGSQDLANKFIDASSGCYNAAMRTSSTCYLHVLAHLLDLSAGDLTESKYGSPAVPTDYERVYTTTTGNHTVTITDNNINGSTIQSTGYSEDMSEVSEFICNPDNNVMAASDPDDTTTESSPELYKLLSNYKFVNGEKVLKTFKEKVVDLFYVVQNRASFKDPSITYDELKPYLKNFQAELAGSLTTRFDEAKYQSDVNAWKNSVSAWLTRIENAKKDYTEDLDNIPAPEIPDPEDPKTEWYINLWHRMNGASDDKSTEGKNGTYYKQLDDNLLNSDTWLQFALEHGVVMLEQVRFVEEAEDDTGLEYSKWTATTYGSCSDIAEVEDEVAIARAEAEYTKKLNEIEAKDKKYDNDLKKLDTEHNALQTEYDSVKSVIEKNVERSFKAFS